MDTRRFQLLDQFYARAVTAPAEERDRILAEASALDAEVGRELERLLAVEPANALLGVLVEKAGASLLAWRKGPERSAEAPSVEPSAVEPPDAGRAETAVDLPDTTRPSSSPAAELLERLAARAPGESRYRIEGEVARGGMGAILRAFDPDLRRVLAMKVALEPSAPLADERQRARIGRFLEEAQITGQLDHPGVVPVHEIGLDAHGRLYFTMRLVGGRDLAAIYDLARKGEEGWSTTRVLGVLLKVCEAMAYAHSKGVIHRDLKPANVMAGRFGEVYVMDWGLAKVLGRADSRDLRVRPPPSVAGLQSVRSEECDTDPTTPLETMDGTVLGTPAYMSPEQASGNVAAMDVRSDVYALGAMLYHLFAGHAPYHEDGETLSAHRLWQKIARVPPEPLTALVPATPRDLVAIVERAMARAMAERYPSVAAFAEDLRAYVEGRVVGAYEAGSWAELRKWIGRNRGLSASLAAAVLILVAGVASTTTFAFRAETSASRAQDNERIANDRAEENAKLAQEMGALATAEGKAREEAVREKDRADRKVREFEQLKGVVLHERAITTAEELYPAWPSKIAAMETWLEDTGRLLTMRGDIEQTVRDLQARALPPTPVEQEADRRSHPRFAALELLSKRVEAWRYAQAIRDGTLQLVVQELSDEQQALDADALNQLAWDRIAQKPEERKVYGEEALGLASARASVAKAAGSATESAPLDTLAWALFANGQDVEAKATSAQALAKAPPDLKQTYRDYQRDLETAISKAAETLATGEKDLADLTTEVNRQRTFRFELESQRFLHDTLTGLLTKLASLQANEMAEVKKRLAWAKQVQGLSLAHPKARHAWAAVRAAIAGNEKYAGQAIELRDQDITGLVPIGENPVTKLWEFYELRSAWDGESDPREIAIPAQKADGSIEATGDMGIVFVLLPGGRFTMGAQRDDRDKPNFDPQAGVTEMPHEVTLAPFFLARHEMTQGQWARLWSGDESLRWPSYYKVGWTYIGIPIPIGRSHPVENVSWEMGDTLLRRSGLSLPTEAQWEFGCRAGTSTPWYTGDVPTSLAGHANVLDRDAVKAYPDWGIAEAFEDAFAGPAPVGHYGGCNAFGLYDMHGNVWELCRDWKGSYAAPWREGDGLRLVGPLAGRCDRGGAFQGPAASARSANRSGSAPLFRGAEMGLRPSRTLRRNEIAAERLAAKVTELMKRTLASTDLSKGGRNGYLVSAVMDHPAWELETGTLEDGPQTEASLAATIAEILLGYGHNEEALQLAAHALITRQRLFPGDHVDVVKSLDCLARCHQARSQVAEALARHKAALAMRQRLIQDDRPEFASNLAAVASCLRSLDQFAEALPYARAALEMRRRLFPHDHRDVAVSFNNVGSLHRSLGQDREALPMFEAAIEMHQRLSKDDRAELSAALHNCGLCLRALRQYDEALSRVQAALEMRQRLSAGDHRDVASSLRSVGVCLQYLDRHAEALPKFKASLEMYQRLSSGDDHEVATSLSVLAGCLKDLGNAAEALPHFEAALEMRQRLFGRDDFAVARSLNYLADCLLALRQGDRALSRFQEALAMCRRLSPGDHSDLATSLNNLAGCLLEMGKGSEALPDFRAALEMFERLKLGDHPHVAATLGSLASCLHSLGQSAEALPYAERANDMAAKTIPAEHPPRKRIVATLQQIRSALKQ
jgi:formylglycine-generating enzyme required for sulfatase activity/tetratricopeptide (TPR) repeat protein